MNWIQTVLEATEEVETPRSYIYWSCLAAISAVVRDKVYVRKKGGVYLLYPNLYVMLIGRSGLGKGFPIATARKLVEETHVTRVIKGRNSIQSIISELGTAHSRNGLPPLIDAHAFIASPELTNLLVDDPKALSILTEFYDTHDNKEWKNSLKSGKEKLKNVCITMLSGSNKAHFRDVVRTVDIEGGFAGRTIFVVEKERAKIDAMIEEDDEDEAVDSLDIPKLAAHLVELSKVEGKFKFTPEAKRLYEPWFHEIRKKESEDITGTVARMPENVQKVAMLLSLSESTDKIFRTNHIEESIKVVTERVQSGSAITRPKGSQAMAEQTELVIEKIADSPEFKISRQWLLDNCRGEFNAYDLDNIVQHLTEADIIESSKEGKIMYYEFTDKWKEKWREILKQDIH